MFSKILTLAAAAALATGVPGAVPALAGIPAAPETAKPVGPLQPVSASTSGRVIPANHYYYNDAYCRRQYRLGFVLGDGGARIFFNRHCHPRWRGDRWRGRHWDRGYGYRYRPGYRRGYRRGYRSNQNDR